MPRNFFTHVLLCFLLLFGIPFVGSCAENSVLHKVDYIRPANLFLVLPSGAKLHNFYSKTKLVTPANVVAFREFGMNGKDYYLVVNPFTLTTFFIVKEDAQNAAVVNRNKRHKLPLFALLEKYANSPVESLSLSKEEGNNGSPFFDFAITVDLCPSPKGVFEKQYLFNWIEQMSKSSHVKIPLAVAVTANWIEVHESEFADIVRMSKNRSVDLIWINHSATHPLSVDKTGKELFLTAKNVNFQEEVFGVEKALLQRGEMPSVFFRFPGLVYNEKLLKELNDLLLIPVGANAWLAKGQQIKNGSIVLVHGNGNEHEGVLLLQKEVDTLKQKKQFSPKGIVSIKNI